MRCFLEDRAFGLWGWVLVCHFAATGVQRAWKYLPVTALHALEGSGSNQKLPSTLFQDKAVAIGVCQMSQRLTPSRNGRSHSVEE